MNIQQILNSISIRSKIYAMTGILIAALLISIFFSLTSIRGIGAQLTAVAEEDIPLTRIATKITVKQLEQLLNFERALRYGQEMKTTPPAEVNFKEAVKHFEAASASIDAEFKKGEAIARAGSTAPDNQKHSKIYKYAAQNLNLIEKEHSAFANSVSAALTLVATGKMHAALRNAEKIEQSRQAMDRALEKLLLKIEASTETASATAEQHEQSANSTLIMIASLTGIATIIIFIVVITGVSRLTRGLTLSLDIAQRIADGDLTEAVDSDGNDEIGKLLAALGVMHEKLHNMITKMNQASTELSTASEELASVSEESNQGIHKQQSEIQQAATAMNEMTAAVQEVASNAQLSSQSANDANTEAQKGQGVVGTTVESIQSLAGVVENANSVIQQVGKDSDNIGGVLDVIKGIAAQTNLLALNAAIEAARAGVHGRGFAVVADEVRTLAQRTQESTSEIQAMITRLQESSRNAVGTMESGREQATSSVEQAVNAGTSLEAITTVASQISDMNTQIASAAEEQTTVSEDINRNITVISQVAGQNAAAVNQISVSSVELSRMATSLQEMISQFNV